MSVYDKKRLKLDLTSKVKKQDNNNAVLTSPDLIKLKLDSPELERIILATAGSATPTPKQYRRIKGASDLTVKEQQEQYVRGFEDALNKMRQESNTTQQNNEPIASTLSSIIISNNNNTITKTSHENEIGLNQPVNGASHSFVKCTSTLPNTLYPSANYVNTSSGFELNTPIKHNLTIPMKTPTTNHMRTAENTPIVKVKAASNTQSDNITAAQLLVDPLPSSGSQTLSEPNQIASVATTSFPSISTVPIDLHQQEEVKTERKKHRNRVAASKCRKRKLERESNLQDTVNELKFRHSELSNLASILRQQVCDLKLQVMDHMKSGCEVLPLTAT